MRTKKSATTTATTVMAVKDLVLYQEYYVQTKKKDGSTGSAIIMRGTEGLNKLVRVNMKRDKVFKPINVDMEKILSVRLATEEDFKKYYRD